MPVTLHRPRVRETSYSKRASFRPSCSTENNKNDDGDVDGDVDDDDKLINW